MIKLERVNTSTFKKIIDMKLPEPQNRFVASNVVSLAQAWLYYEDARPFTILNDEEVVGFLMLDWDEEERSIGIWRFMIATEHQHKGYGRAAIQEVISLAKSTQKFDFIYLDYVEDNVSARKLYYSMGFRENGEVEDNEIVMILPLTDNPEICAFLADEEDVENFLELANEQVREQAVPSFLSDEAMLKEAIEQESIIRFTLLGQTVAIANVDELFIVDEYSEHIHRIQQKHKEFLKKNV